MACCQGGKLLGCLLLVGCVLACMLVGCLLQLKLQVLVLFVEVVDDLRSHSSQADKRGQGWAGLLLVVLFTRCNMLRVTTTD